MQAQPAADYEVTITNLTPGQTSTPRLVITHGEGVHLFMLGLPASEELADLAESGNTAPLYVSVANDAMGGGTMPGLLGPGESDTLIVTANPGRGHLSVAAMLIPTNDTFVGLDALKLPRSGSITVLAGAYDAGSEANDQNCANIPGPQCGGEGLSAPAATDEGYVHVGSGIHDLGETDEAGNRLLDPAVYDWGGAVASITVRRMN